MKPSNESTDHQKILGQRRLDQDDARHFLNDKTSNVQGSMGDWAIRVLTNDLTGGERRERRMRAWVVKKVQKFIPVETVKEEPQNNEKSPFTLEAVKEWLEQLWNINVIEKPGKSGPEFFASISGITLWRSLLVGSPHDREIMGETAEVAIKNYFTEARLATAIEWPNWKKYAWVQKDLQFIERIPREDNPLIRIRRKKQYRRKILERNEWTQSNSDNLTKTKGL